MFARLFASLLVLLIIAAPIWPASAAAGDGDPAFDGLKLNQVQVLGSHNSYRPFPSPEAERRIRSAAGEDYRGLEYGHPPLEAQLALGIRQIEIDVGADPKGGAYVAPYAAKATPAFLAHMNQPGAKVLHIPPVDIETHCAALRDCLAILRRWSDAHPGHLPVTVLVNASDFDARPTLPQGMRFEAADLDAIDSDIRAVIGAQRLITPDDVRGAHHTLAGAVRANAWPSIGTARGRFLFVLDGNSRHESLYRSGHPSLKGRVMFGFYEENEAEAAIFNIQDPTSEGDRIARLVKAGFLVRTRADAGTAEARRRDLRRAQAAVASGAQFISTDYYDGVPDPLGLKFRVDLGEGAKIRCNAVTARCPAARRP